MLGSIISKFDAKAKNHMEQQSLNPFSGNFSRSPSPRLSKDQYGKPLAGSKTEERGQKAKCHILREIQDLCNCIHDVGVYNKTNKHHHDSDDEEFNDDEIIVTFGEIFQIYTKINDKVVGLLIAAKKRGFIYFEKEILFQRRDDDVLIALIKPINEIRAIINKELASNSSPTPFASREVSPAVDSDDSSHQSTSKKKKVVKHKKHHDEKEDGTTKHQIKAKEQHDEIKDKPICNGDSSADKAVVMNETPEINPPKPSSESNTPSHDTTADNQLIQDKTGSELPTTTGPVTTENDKPECSKAEDKEKAIETHPEPAAITEPLKIPTLEITSAPDNADEITNENGTNDKSSKGETAENDTRPLSSPVGNVTSELPDKQEVIHNVTASDASDPCIETQDKRELSDGDTHEINNMHTTDTSVPEVLSSESSLLTNTTSENNAILADINDTKTSTEGLEIVENNDNNAPVDIINQNNKVECESNELSRESTSPSVLSNDHENCQVQGANSNEKSDAVNEQSHIEHALSNVLLNSSPTQSDGCITPDPCDEEVQQILQSHSSSHVSSYTETKTTYEETTETTYEESTES